MAGAELNYSSKVEILTALVAYLARMKKEKEDDPDEEDGPIQQYLHSRSLTALSAALGSQYEETEIKEVVEHFSGIFRKSGKGGYYGLHLRFADDKPLDSDMTTMLFDMIARRGAVERAEKQQHFDNRIAVWGAVSAALFSAIAAVVSIIQLATNN